MAEQNLLPLVAQVFGHFADKRVAFAWGQTMCTAMRRPGGGKPLFLKELGKLRGTRWEAYMPHRVMLVDDDPSKCANNPEATIHPATFAGGQP